MSSRFILTHTLHPKMLRPEIIQKEAKGILRFAICEEKQEHVEMALDQIEFVNAFANLAKLSVVNQALNMQIEYSKIEDLVLQPNDVVLIPVIENLVILYWLKIIVTAAYSIGAR